MDDKTFTEWLQSEATYCAERASSVKDVSKKQYWIGRQQAYANAIDRYNELQSQLIDKMGTDYGQ